MTDSPSYILEMIHWRVREKRTIMNIFTCWEIDTPYVKNMPLRAKQVDSVSNLQHRLYSEEGVTDVAMFLIGHQARYLDDIKLPILGGSERHN